MSAPEHAPSKPSFLGRLWLRLVSTEGGDGGSMNIFSMIKRKLKNITTKNDKPVDKAMIRIVKAAPAWDDVVPGTEGPPIPKPKRRKGAAIFLYGTDIPIMEFVKDPSLPAPSPIKPSLRYVYGDPYVPANLKVPNSFEPKANIVAMTLVQYEVNCLLEKGRQYCKEDVLFKFQSVLCECSSEELDDMVELFVDQKHILPLELAQGILSRQGTDKQWKREMKIGNSLMLPEHIQPRMRFFKRREIVEKIRAGARPGPSPLTTEILIDEDAQVTTPHSARTGSNTSASTMNSEITLLGDDVANEILKLTEEPEAMDDEEVKESTQADVETRSDTEYGYEADISKDSLILLANGFSYNPLARTVARKSVKLECSDSIYSGDSKVPTESIRKRIRRFVGFPRN